MEVKDAYEKLNITPAEKASVERYLGFLSTRINSLLDMEPYKLASLEQKGWLLHETPQEIFEDVETFASLYAVMLKNEGPVHSTLYRGTTDNECRTFSNKTKKCVSTSFDETIAKSFCEYGNAALIRYKVSGNIPHIDTSYFRDENSKDEEEIILPPFAKIKRFDFTSKWDGYKFYDVRLEKGDLKEYDDKMFNKDSLRQYIEENFESFKRYVDAVRYGKKDSTMFDDEYRKAYKFKAAVEEYTTIVCREREIEIEKAKGIVDAENTRKEEEFRVRLEEEKTRAVVVGMADRLEGAELKKEEFFAKLGSIDSLVDTENRFVYYATRLKIPFSRRLEPRSLGKRINRIKDAVGRMVDKTKTVSIDRTGTVDDATLQFEPVRDDIEAVESLGLDVSGIDYLPHIFEEKMHLQLKEKIDRRAFDVIKRLRIQKHKIDLESIPANPSLWSRLSGKARIQSLQKENLKYKIELERLSEYEPKRTYSIRDTLSDLYAEQMKLGISNNEITDFVQAIQTVYSVGKEDVTRLTMEKVNKTRNLPVNFDAKRVTNRKQEEYLEEVNEFLRKSLEASRSKNQQRAGKANSDLWAEKRENFLSDDEMFNSVNLMLTNIERKTVHRVFKKDKSEQTRQSDPRKLDDTVRLWE